MWRGEGNEIVRHAEGVPIRHISAGRTPRPTAQRDQWGIISSTARIDAPAGEPSGTSSALDRGNGRKGRDAIADDLPATVTCDM